MPPKKVREVGIKSFNPESLPPSCSMIIIGPPASGKCFGAGTLILMYDRTLKKVEDIRDGDFLMGDDGTPRKVEGTVKGRDRLYRITNIHDGTSHVVNLSHVMCLRMFSKPMISVILEPRDHSSSGTSEEIDRTSSARRWMVSWVEGNVEEEVIFSSLSDANSFAKDFEECRVGTNGCVENVLEISVEEYLLKFSSPKEIESLEGYGLYRKTLQSGDGVTDYFDLGRENLAYETGQEVSQLLLEGKGTSHAVARIQMAICSDLSHRRRFLDGMLSGCGGENLFLETGLRTIPLPREFTPEQLSVFHLFLRSMGFEPLPKIFWRHGEARLQFEDPLAGLSETQTESTHLISSRFESIATFDFIVEPAKNHPGSVFDPETEDVMGDYYGFSVDGNGRFLLGDLTVTHNTTLMENFSFYLKHRYPVARVFIGTEDGYKRFCNIFHPLFVSNYWSEEEEKQHINRQKMMEMENGRGYPGNYAVNIIDDVGDDPKIYKTKVMRGIFKLGSQHWAQLAMIGSQYAIDMPPDIRKSVSYVALGREPEENERKKLYSNFGGMCGSFPDFCSFMTGLTGDHTFMIIKKRSQTNNIEDCVFWFKTQQLGDWKFGCREAAEWAKQRYNPKYVEQIMFM